MGRDARDQGANVSDSDRMTCPDCHGAGCLPVTIAGLWYPVFGPTCTTCAGGGFVSRCPHCKGSGADPDVAATSLPCPECDGVGVKP